MPYQIDFLAIEVIQCKTYGCTTIEFRPTVKDVSLSCDRLSNRGPPRRTH